MARNIAVQADGYAKAFKTMLADPSVQRFTIRIGRTVSPVVQLFLDRAREVAKTLAKLSQ